MISSYNLTSSFIIIYHITCTLYDACIIFIELFKFYALRKTALLNWNISTMGHTASKVILQTYHTHILAFELLFNYLVSFISKSLCNKNYIFIPTFDSSVRMESKEICETAINKLCGQYLQGNCRSLLLLPDKVLYPHGFRIVLQN